MLTLVCSDVRPKGCGACDVARLCFLQRNKVCEGISTRGSVPDYRKA